MKVENYIQTVSFECPSCRKVVTVKSNLNAGYLRWLEEPKHDEGCLLEFVIERHLPRIRNDLAISAPIIFATINSATGLRELAKIERDLMLKEKDDGKKLLYSKRITRLQSLQSSNRDKLLETVLESVKTGAFGLRIYVGHRMFAYLWKWANRFFGIVHDENQRGYISSDWILASGNFEEAKSFAFNLFHYWDVPKKGDF
jgi:hypothetical protein